MQGMYVKKTFSLFVFIEGA